VSLRDGVVKPKTHQTMWGGRFAASPAETLRKFSESVSFDRRFYRQDIRGSLAHAGMLRRVGLLTGAELATM
jgi:argininosuccinate lyase